MYQTQKFREIASSSPSQASDLRTDIALNRLKAFTYLSDSLEYEHPTTREKAAYSIRTALLGFIKYDEVDAFFDLLENILSSDLRIGPICGDLAQCIRQMGSSELANSSAVKARTNRALGRLGEARKKKHSADEALQQIEAEFRSLLAKKQRA